MVINGDHLAVHHHMLLPSDDGIEHARSNGHKAEIIHNSPAKVHLDAVEDAPAEEDKLENGIQLGVEEDEASRVHGDVRAGRHGDTNVGGCESGRVVNAVADEGDYRP